MTRRVTTTVVVTVLLFSTSSLVLYVRIRVTAARVGAAVAGRTHEQVV